MNKQELIEKYKSTLNKVHKVYGDYYKTEAYEEVLKDLKQLDEPQKPVVPKFVADWYEENKADFEGNLFRCIDCIPDLYDEEELNDFEEWIIDSRTKPFQTLVNMHQFGYEVEQEKRYTVKMKGMDKKFTMFKLDKIRGSWYLGNDTEYSYTKTTHTRKELEEAGFGEVFNSPLFEVEEVEE